MTGRRLLVGGLAGCFLLASGGCTKDATTAQPSSVAPEPAVAGTDSCTDTLRCYASCSDGSESCRAACDGRAAPGVPTLSRATVVCIEQSGCADDDCALKTCAAEVDRCRNASVAAAPAPTAAPAPAAAGGGGVVTAADLAGTWKRSSSSSIDFVTAAGVYGGSDTAVSSEKRTLRGDGTYTTEFHGMSNTAGQIHSTKSGTFHFDSGFIIFTDGETGFVQQNRIVRFETSDGITILTLLFHTYPVDATNIMYNGETWVRGPAE